MPLTLTLTCDTCGAAATPASYYRMTKFGTYRLQGRSQGFYIDGAKVLCRAHRPNPMPSVQYESWSEHDRRNIEGVQEEEARLDEIVRQNPGLVRA